MHTDVYPTSTPRWNLLDGIAGKRVHLIGIGGSGMSGAAAMLLGMGAQVSGSDVSVFAGMGELVSRGASIAIGHHEGQLLPDAALVVMSAAIPPTNPELVAARKLGIPIMKYAELVGAISASRRGIAIAGTHGKSTTTGLTAFVLRECGLDPSFIIGARSSQLGGGSGVGGGTHFVVEACEFDRSFLHCRPHSAAMLNVEPDHLDCFRDLDDIVEAFSRFAALVDPAGLLVCNAADPAAISASRSSLAPVETFGFDSGADWQAAELRYDRGRFAFEVLYRDELILATSLSIPGRHNVSNALAAIALAHHAGAHPRLVADAVRRFTGMDRRLTYRGEVLGVAIVDDYAHHPTEIRVTLEAVRDRYEPRRLWVVFQPHQCKRTRRFMNDFAVSFGLADEVIIPDVYGARESDPCACRSDSQELAARVCDAGRPARHFSSLDEVTAHLLKNVTKGDLVLTMGAGDVWKVADELLARIRKPAAVRRSAGAPNVVPARGKRAVRISAS